MSAVLITGTDTGVGKTHVTVGLLKALKSRGFIPFSIKPVETGCDDLSRPEDGMAIAAALDALEHLDLIAPFRLRLPAAPMTAAAREGVTLREASLMAAVQRAGALGEPLLIEGAGGLLVPITADFSFAELARQSGARVVIVARDALGTINHTRLTLLAARTYGLEVIAVVLNATATSRENTLEHAAALRQVTDVPVFGPLAWGGDAARELEALGVVERVLSACASG